MKKIIKLELGIAIFALFFATTLNVNGTTINSEVLASTTIGEKINERSIAIPDSKILLKLWI